MAQRPKVSRLQACRHDFQRSISRSGTWKKSTGAHDTGRTVPGRDRHALPVAAGAAGRPESEPASLRARVGFELQRLIVLPGDVNPSRQAHDSSGAVRSALFASGFIAGRIPRVGHLTCRCVQRHAREVAFRRCRHAEAPVLGDERDPVARQIDGRGGSRRCRGLRRTTALTWRARMEHGAPEYHRKRPGPAEHCSRHEPASHAASQIRAANGF
jgi:hypothetical protein